MDKLSERLTNYIMLNNKKDLDYDVVRYGMDAILSTILCLGCAITIATILNGFKFSLIFIFFLTPIKMSFTGYHCKTLGQCISTYGICVGVFTLIYKYIILQTVMVPLMIFYCIMLFIIFLIRKELKKRNIFMLAIYIFGGTISYFTSYDLFVILTLSTLFELALLCMLQLNHIK